MSTPNDPYGQQPHQGYGQAPSYGQQPQQGYGQAPVHGQQPYGAAPAYGSAPWAGGYGAAPGPVTRPSTVTYAVYLMYAGAFLSVLAGVLTVTTRGQLEEEFQRQAQLQGGAGALPPDFLDTFFGIIVVVAIVFGLLFAGLWIMNAVACSRGRNWGRITGTVLGGLYVLSALASLVQPSTGLTLTITLLTTLVAIATIVLLWQRASNQYFAAAGAARRAGH